MNTLVLGCTTLGVYLWYATTTRIKVKSTYAIEKWSSAHREKSKLVGTLFIMMAGLISIAENGLGAGSLSFLVDLMLVASLIIILTPLGLLSRPMVILLFGFCVFVEILI